MAGYFDRVDSFTGTAAAAVPQLYPLGRLAHHDTLPTLSHEGWRHTIDSDDTVVALSVSELLYQVSATDDSCRDTGRHRWWSRDTGVWHGTVLPIRLAWSHRLGLMFCAGGLG